jgi:ubiquitin related modifier 1
MSTISLKIEFGGGLELLFDNKRSHRITVPAFLPSSSEASKTPSLSTSTAVASDTVTSDDRPKPVDARYLIYWLRDNLLRERPELFIEDATV